ncbi:MAG TPA: TRAP transporter TatT component family protein, partial [Bacteroidota bacterium]|nr:TRAP transporter TatT component family protein [Bacteroidota bacterium]
MGNIMDNGFAVINEEQDLDIADKSIASNLTLLETVLRSDPDNDHYLLLASIGYTSYALGFVEDESIDRARLLYLRGKNFGMKILLHDQAFADALTKGPGEFAAALSSFSQDDVPAIFWTAVSWGSYINVTLTDPSAIADLPKVEAMMRFVVQHDPAF